MHDICRNIRKFALKKAHQGCQKFMKYSTTLFTLLLVLSFGTTVRGQINNIYGPYLQNIKAAEATVVWEADKQSIGWVELAPDDGSNFYSSERPKYFDCTNGVKNTSLIHTVKLTNLKANTTYRYRIYSKQVLTHNGTFVNYDNHVAATDVYSKAPLHFTTLDPGKKETSFVVLNDVHGKKNFITPLMKLVDYQHKDLIFFNGDMISVLNKKEDFFEGFMNECIGLFAQEKSPYYARGNHETRGEFSTHFQEYFSPREPHLYFTVRQGPIYFILLDAGEDKPDDDIEYSGIVDYDNYRTEQAEWLKTLVNDPDYQTAKFRVVICHMPTRIDKNDWHGMTDCTNKFAPILNHMNINVMLAGHTHSDSYHEPNANIQYPVLVNSNEGIIEAQTKDNELDIRVIHKDGNVVAKKVFTAKN